MRIECEKCEDIVDVTADSVSAPFWCNACEDVPSPYASDADAIIADLKEQNDVLRNSLSIAEESLRDSQEWNRVESERYAKTYDAIMDANVAADGFKQTVINPESQIEDLKLQLETAHSFAARSHMRVYDYRNSLTDAENENLNLSLELVQARMDTEKMRKALGEANEAVATRKSWFTRLMEW